MLAIPPPSDAATKTILSAILTGFLGDFAQEVQNAAGAIVEASIETYNR